MASIAGLSCTFGMPENDEREQKISLGQAVDGSCKYIKYGKSRKTITIPVRGLSTTDKTTLENYLESSINQMVRLEPDSHIDLGGGKGVPVDAQVLDPELDFQKTNHEYWEGSLTFALGFISFTPNEDLVYIKTKIKVEGTQASPELFITNSGKLLYNYGTTPFPEINLANAIVSVECNGTPYQDTTTCNQVGDISQSGANIAFSLAINDIGDPSDDGFFYFDITIKLQSKV